MQLVNGTKKSNSENWDVFSESTNNFYFWNRKNIDVKNVTITLVALNRYFTDVQPVVSGLVF